MSTQDLSQILSSLTADKISVDEQGRVVIDDPQIAAQVRDAAGKEVLAADPSNGNCGSGGCNTVLGCSTNTAIHCGALKAVEA
ncbi:hypothetical protein [Streptomyces sp. NPDC005281]|uniref:hypothetical protein n=1 Tax=Streptomyces sp. NPDC005281 TaxID=3155712 RepID=UPI0033B9F30C